jgi:aspartyl protease family protein
MRLWLAVIALTGFGSAALAFADHEVLSRLEVRDVMMVAGVLLGLTGLFLAASAPVPVPVTGRTGGRVLRSFVALMALTGGSVAAYTYRYELLVALHSAAGETGVLQTEVQTEGTADKSVRIRRRPEGHFVAEAKIEGQSLTLLVDTGATTVVLRPADARALGFDPDKLRYTVPVQTANGTTYAASVKLRSLGVGPIHLRDVEALVAKPGTLKDSLLGMSFLNRLRSYEFSGDLLTLRI